MSRDSQPMGGTYPAVLLVSGAALAIQVTFTRVFSITLWHHFTYLVISIALLGYGVAGAYLARRGRTVTGNESNDVVLARRCRNAALASCAAYLFSTLIHCDALQLFRDPSVALALLVVAVLSAVPFFGAGAVIATALARHAGRAGPIYAADLLGAGLGAVLAMPALDWLGAPRVIFAACSVMALGGVVASVRAGRAQLARTLVALAVPATLLLVVRNEDPWVVPAPTKEIWATAWPSGRLPPSEVRRWTPVGRIDVAAEGPSFPIMGGEFGRGSLMVTPAHLVTQDGAAPTWIFRSPRDKPLPFLRHSSTAAVWLLRGVMLGDDGVAHGSVGAKSLVIGVGGGIDLQIALAHGASQVTGVDLNPTMLSLLTGKYRSFTGDLAGRVRLVAGEGRAFIRGTDEKFDVIQLSGVDTYTALSQGAYSVAEAYLYTVEALSDFLSHLTAQGCVSFSRWALEPPRETLRLAVTAREALQRGGAAAPERHILILRGPSWASMVACRQPIGPAGLPYVRAFAQYEGYRMVYDPLRPGRTPYDRALRGSAQTRASFIRDYPYQIAPATDDSPFFFNYFRWNKLGELRRMKTELVYASPVPIGHGIVIGGLIITTLLALAGILIPALGQRELRARAARPSLVLYFAGLGIAYLVVEVVFLQRITFLLGHPSFALPVVLAGLLVASGGGAAASRRLTRHAHWLALILPAALIAAALLSRMALPVLLPFGFATRLAAALAVIVPLGFLMGIPFPLGIERLRQAEATGGSVELVSWAFAVNAFFTVIAASLATLVAMETGFTLLLLVAAGIYAGALAAIYPRLAGARPV